MRICSLLPSATEILYALGAGEDVVAVSHECDYPADARAKARALRAFIDPDRLSSGAIDEAVRAAIASRRSLYEIDPAVLQAARPDVVITQSLCKVCAVDAEATLAAVRDLKSPPQIVTLHPHSLEDILNDIRLLGRLINRVGDADRLLQSCQARIDRVQALIPPGARRPDVFCLEWLSPLMATGHWVPEMVELAGGREVLGRPGAPSRYVTWEEVAAARPEVLVLMPCGFPIERTRREVAVLSAQPLWSELPAVRNGRVYLVEGPAYFNCSGPRLIDGIELLAGLFHPDQCRALMPHGAAEPLLTTS